MKTIWKFTLEPDVRHNNFFMPKGAKILSLQVQRGQPCLWVLVDDTLPVEKRSFWIAGTGHEIPASPAIQVQNFVDTFQVEGGDFVFHVFEVSS